MASSSSRRPVPQIIVENKATPPTLKEGESDSGGRRHISASVPRTSFTPQAEKEALNKLKQKMTFSDHSGTSSCTSTPSKVVSKCHTDPHKPRSGRSFVRPGLMTEPMKKGHKSVRRPHVSPPPSSTRQGVKLAPSIPTSYSYGEMTSSSRKVKDTVSSDSDEGLSSRKVKDTVSSDSDEDISSSVTISSLLSKLDSVKSFLKEAEEMRVKFDARKTEPGMLAELNKLDKVVEQLQEQESGYLGELLRLMDMESELVQGEIEEATDEEEEGENEPSDDEAENIVRVTSRKSVDASMEDSGDEESLSLRAQMELEQEAQQELLALQQRKQMLTQLLEKQKQIQELEAKQAALLEMKTNAEAQLREAESRGLELQQSPSEAQTNETANKEGALLKSKFAELRARKERMDQISKLLHSVGRIETEEEQAVTASPRSLERGGGNRGDGGHRGARLQLSAQAARGESGTRRDELVSEDTAADSRPSMDKVIQLSREAANIRRSLREAEALIGMQTGEMEKHKDRQRSWRMTAEPARPQTVDRNAEVEKHKDRQRSWRMTAEPPRPQTVDRNAEKQELSVQDTLDHDPSEFERSLVSDYEAKLSRKKGEVLQLLKEREELKSTHKRLLNLQKKMNARQTDSLQLNTDHDVHSQTDVTGATWGGSTVPSDPEEEASSTSLPSDIVADITQESNPNYDEVTAHGEGATIEQTGRTKTPPPPFMVTRHTPRTSNVRPRTTSLDSTQADQLAKKIKMEERSTPNEKQRAANPLLKSSGAKQTIKELPPTMKCGGLFGSSNDSGFAVGSRADSMNRPTLSGPPLFNASFGATTTNQSLGGAPPVATMGNNWGAASFQQRESLLSQQHTATLHNQLTLTSNMCSQLLHGQNNLIRAVCQRLDHSDLHSSTQEQMSAMQQYQMDLEAYYQQLCESYMQLKEQQQQQHEPGDGGVPESEEPVASAVPAMNSEMDNEGSPVRPPNPVPSGVSFQMEPTDSIPEPVPFGISQPWTLPQFYGTPQPKPLDSRAEPMSYLPPPPLPGNSYASPNFLLHGDYAAPQFYGSPSSFLPPPGAGMGPNPFRYEKSPSLGHGMPSLSFPNSGFSHNLQAFPHGAGRPPYFYPSPSMMVDPGSGFDAHGHFGNRPGHLNFQTGDHAGRGVGFGILGSPSGVTASSLQVNAPTSPTSMPSAGMQPSSENASNTNGNQQQEAEPTSQSAVAAAAAAVTTTVNATSMNPFVTAKNSVGGVGTVAVSSAIERKKEQRETADGDVDSMSSLPLSVPDRPQARTGEDESTGFSVFDALRDTIYSEVATFIAKNENRPHFLVEVFRELQMLSTDYLRQRALYSLQDLVTRFLTEETAGGVNGATASWLVEESGSESDGESSVVHSKPVLLNQPSQGYDYVEPVRSASSVSTPTHEPFASDSLGDTVVRLDRAMARLKIAQMQAETSGSLNVSGLSEQLGDGTSSGDGGDGEPQEDLVPFTYPLDMNTQALDEQIKTIMIDVIPLLKGNIDKECDDEIMGTISDRILSLVLEQEKNEKPELLESFRDQLCVSVNTVMEKFSQRRLRDCGEDMLMDVSEVLFNELAFFKIMQDCRGQPQLSRDFEDIAVPQATDEVGQTGGGSRSADGPTGNRKPLDPTLLQILSVSANLTLQEEEDTLGKVRDDALATMWDPNVHLRECSMSDEQNASPNMSTSKSQPTRSVGSGNGAGPTGVDGVANGLPGFPRSNNPTGGVVTPPAVASPSNASGLPLLVIESAVFSPEDQDVSIEKVATISQRAMEAGQVNHQPLLALSPPATAVPTQTVMPQISSLTESDLEARVKAEQECVEGVDGVLASMKEPTQSPDEDLVGDGDDVTTPVNGI